MVVLLIQVSLAFANPVSTSSACDDFHTTVTASLEALWTGSVSEMRHHLERSEERLACLEPLEKETVQEDLGHWYLLKAYDAHLKEDISERTWWLKQSVQLGYWDPNFGPEIETFRSEVDVSKQVVLSILPTDVREDIQIWVDGTEISEELDVQMGMHWIEVYAVDNLETALYVEFLRVQEGAFIRLPDWKRSIDLADVSVEKSRNRLWLSSAMLWSAIGLSSHTMAMMNYQLYPQSTSLVELEQRRTQTWRWGQVSLGSAALTGISVGLWWLDVDRENPANVIDTENAGLE